MIRAESSAAVIRLEGALSMYLNCRVKFPWEVWGHSRPCPLWVLTLKEQKSFS